MNGPGQKEAFEMVRSVLDQAAAAWHWVVGRGGTDQSAETGLQMIVEKMLPALYRHAESMQRGGKLLPLLELALAGPAEGQRNLPLRTILLVAKTAFYRSGLPIRFEANGSVVPFDDQLEEAWLLAEAQPLPAFWRITLCYSYGRNVDREKALASLRLLVDTLREQNASWELAFALHHLAHLMQFRLEEDEVNRSEAAAHLDEALRILESLGDNRESGYVLRNLGQLHRLREEFALAISYWEESRARLDEVGEWSIAAFLHWNIGDAYLQMGDVDAAFAHYRTMTETALAHGSSSLAGDMLGKESYEAARYGRLELALETKRLALTHARAAGDIFTEAWTTWEMGELCRLRGELDEAVVWYERSRPLFAQYGDQTGYSFYYRGLGDVAAARGFHAVAASNFEQSLQEAEENGHSWAQGYALIGRARTSLAAQQLAVAREQMARALDVSRATGDRAITLAALVVAAEILYQGGQTELALEVANFVAAHPISWTESRTRAEQIAAASQLPPPAVCAAKERAQEREIWALVSVVCQVLVSSEAVTMSGS
ncbi:MAG: tetratricopeptide repeat protein [Anaerolineae bacterium]|nr:tetratricopeptide repeat protein [Anaerolineae bacterium]